MTKNASRIIYIIFVSCLIFVNCPVTLTAQISEGGTPPSFSYLNVLKSTSTGIDIPITFSVEDLKVVDAWNVSQGAPLKVATLIPADLSMENAGEWSTLPGGEKIWQLQIQAQDAIALNLYYKEFYIPVGGKLFIYNADHTQIIGAYTSKTNPSGAAFATEYVAGDDIILEYVHGTSEDLPRIHIGEIGYGYNHLFIGNTPKATGEGSSGSCNVNINCPEGDNWQSQKNGVCQLVMKNGSSTYICSGALMNNVEEDFKPYILSAYHCMVPNDIPASASDMNQWIFYFHYEETGCDNLSDATATRKTMTGCVKKASTPIDGGSDGLLLLINQEIPESYNVYYNGWNINDTGATSGVGIHHPAGDAMKISTFTNAATSYTWAGSDSTVGLTKAHWNIIFAQTVSGHGITEGGSSGSPLFNQNKQVVGTLTGGSSSCTDLSGLNLYGKLAYHWDKYNPADTSRMDIYLDPANTNVTFLAGRFRAEPKSVPQNLVLNYNFETVTLTWTAPSPSTGLSGYKVYRGNDLLTTTSSTTYTDNTPPEGLQYYSVSAVYSDGIESEAIGKSVTILTYSPPATVTAVQNGYNVVVSWSAPSGAVGLSDYKVYKDNALVKTTTSTSYTDLNPSEGHHYYGVAASYANGSLSEVVGKGMYVFGYKAPTNFATEQDGHDVRLTWKAPQYEQIIQWGTTNYKFKIKESQGSDFYFGQAWSSGEISPLNKKTITAVNFVPNTSSCNYSIYVAQGTRKYTQAISNPTLNQINTIALTTPFVIDGTTKLYVAIKASNYGSTEFPAACDEGPAVNLKGNIYSKNTTTWNSLPSDSNYNFIVQAVISSEEGTLTQTLSEPASSVPETSDSISVAVKQADLMLRATTYETIAYSPVVFPSVSGYNVYKDNNKLNSTLLTEKTYSDLQVAQGSYQYGVSSVFGTIESPKTTESIAITFTGLDILPSDNVQVYPSPFTNQLYISESNAPVNRIDIIATDGRVALSVPSPGNVVNTSGLSPGYYIIRLYHNNKTTVVKAIKR